MSKAKPSVNNILKKIVKEAVEEENMALRLEIAELKSLLTRVLLEQHTKPAVVEEKRPKIISKPAPTPKREVPQITEGMDSISRILATTAMSMTQDDVEALEVPDYIHEGYSHTEAATGGSGMDDISHVQAPKFNVDFRDKMKLINKHANRLRNVND